MGGSYCEWFGITCKPSLFSASEVQENEVLLRSQVTKIQLAHQRLAGTITSNISVFKELEWLIMDSNEIQGTLPSLVKSKHLERFMMGYNKLEGSIPDLSHQTKLRYLMLQHNNFTEKPPSSLSDLVHLQYLSMSDNRLNGTLPELNKLLHLKALWVSNNELSGVFPSLEYQQELQMVDIRNNVFEGLHHGICNLSYGFFADKAIHRCHVANNPIQCDKFPVCARDGCDTAVCQDGANGTVYFEHEAPRRGSSTPTPISTRPPVVHIEGQPIQGSSRDSIAITSPISEGVDNRRQY
jgi:hypothetical protein